MFLPFFLFPFSSLLKDYWLLEKGEYCVSVGRPVCNIMQIAGPGSMRKTKKERKENNQVLDLCNKKNDNLVKMPITFILVLCRCALCRDVQPAFSLSPDMRCSH